MMDLREPNFYVSIHHYFKLPKTDYESIVICQSHYFFLILQ